MTTIGRTTFILLAATVVAQMTASFSAAQQAPKAPKKPSVKQRFKKHDAARDVARIRKLWRANPDRVLGTIDSYLEGSLKLVEDAKGNPDDATKMQIRAMHARARRGAVIADLEFKTKIFSDYASAFTDWTTDQQKSFRGGQQAFGKARRALRDGDAKAALKHASECVNLASPLGDWWGMAMGLGGVGRAYVELGNKAAAVAPLQRARLIYHDLRLRRSELAQTRTLATVLVDLGSMHRARSTCRDGLALAKTLRDKRSIEHFEALAARLAQAARGQ